MVKKGVFREDLFFRLNSFIITIPPLKEHLEDIKELVHYYIPKICERFGTGTKGISTDFIEILKHYDWPGNVRELINALENAVASVHQEPTLFSRHLPVNIRVDVVRRSVSKKGGTARTDSRSTKQTAGAFPDFQEFRKSGEKEYLKDLISTTRGDVKKMCDISGLSRSRLYALLKTYQLKTRP